MKLSPKHFRLAACIVLIGLFLSLMACEWASLRSEGLHYAEWHTTSMAEFLKRDLAHHYPIEEVLKRLDVPEIFANLDLHVQQKIGFLGLLKLKIYDSQGTIIYSNDHQQIGQRFTKNKRFNRAMNGVVVSEIISPKEYLQEYGIISCFNLAEVSVPIRSKSDGNVKYVLEAYYDYTPIKTRMNHLLISKTITLVAIFIVVT